MTIVKGMKRSMASPFTAANFTKSGIAQITLNILIPLGIGIIIGSSISITTVVLKNLDGNELRSATKLEKGGNDNDGWHTISVYYGKKNSIKAQDAPALLKNNIMEGSQAKQDDIVSSLVSLYRDSDKTNKKSIKNDDKLYFVDLASNDAISLSNTFKLEQNGWDGLCIEPNPLYWFRLAHRNCTVAGAFVGGSSDLQEVDVSLSNKEVGGIVGSEFDNKNGPRTEKRFTVSINSLFEKFNVPQTIDYLSLDVEGAEELIMKDFPFDSYKINFLTIERPNKSLQTLMKQQDYHFVMQLVSWGETLWVHGNIVEKFGLEEIKKNALKAMGVEDHIEWPPSSWKNTRHFSIEAGYYTN